MYVTLSIRLNKPIKYTRCYRSKLIDTYGRNEILKNLAGLHFYYRQKSNKWFLAKFFVNHPRGDWDWTLHCKHCKLIHGVAVQFIFHLQLLNYIWMNGTVKGQDKIFQRKYLPELMKKNPCNKEKSDENKNWLKIFLLTEIKNESEKFADFFFLEVKWNSQRNFQTMLVSARKRLTVKTRHDSNLINLQGLKKESDDTRFLLNEKNRGNSEL